MDGQENEVLARQRAAVIWRVRSGAITARQAARELGVSRKTYYEWEVRAMEGMMEALKNQPAGRPVRADGAQQEDQPLLTSRIQTLERELAVARQTVEVSNILDAWHRRQEQLAAAGAKEKKRQSGSA
jgi:transposase